LAKLYIAIFLFSKVIHYSIASFWPFFHPVKSRPFPNKERAAEGFGSAAVVGILTVLGGVFGLVGTVLFVGGLAAGIAHILVGTVLLVIGHFYFTSFIFCGVLRCRFSIPWGSANIPVAKINPLPPFCSHNLLELQNLFMLKLLRQTAVLLY
jgi:hypothetical protein